MSYLLLISLNRHPYPIYTPWFELWGGFCNWTVDKSTHEEAGVVLYPTPAVAGLGLYIEPLSSKG